jgi:hypothetical protein
VGERTVGQPLTWQDVRMTGDDHAAAMTDTTVVPPLPVTPTGAVARWTTAATAVVAALVVLGAYAGTWAVAAGALVAVVLLAWGWPRLLDLPSPRGTTATVAAGGAAGVVAVALTGGEPRLDWLALALGGGVVAEFVHQLARRDGRPRLVESVTGTVWGLVSLAGLATMVALPQTPAAVDGVVVWAGSVVVALAAMLLPLPARSTFAIGAVAGTLVGGLLGGVLDADTVLAGLVAGGLSAVVALLVHRTLAVLPAASRAPGWVALAVAPITTSSMVAYVALRLIVG